MQESKRFKTSFGILSCAYVVLGLIMVLFPTISQRVICYLLGAALVITGIIRIAFFFMKEGSSRIFRNDLAVGIVLLVAGVYLLAKPDAIWVWLPVFLGFAILFDSVIKLQNSFELKRLEFSLWWVVLIAAIATGVLGTLLILDLFSLMVFFGIVLLVDGIVNLATLVMLSLAIKREGKEKKPPKMEKNQKEPSTDYLDDAFSEDSPQ